jgi:hypothetical protein
VRAEGGDVVNRPEHRPNANGYCACWECHQSRRIRDFAERAEYQARETAKLEAEVRKLRAALSAERQARLTAEMHLAIERGDNAAYVKAMREREAA